MIEKIESCFKNILASLQTAKFYGTQHPMFKNSVSKAHKDIEDVLLERQELVIGIVGDELAFEKEILFELSKLAKSAIVYLKEKGIEKITFYRGLKEEELGKFVTFLATSKEEEKKDIQEYLTYIGIKNIAAGKLKAASPVSASDFKAPDSLLKLYEKSLDKTAESIAGALNLEAIDHMELRFAMNNIMENLGSQYQEVLKLTTIKRYDIQTYVHLLNVAILSMHFASKLGFSKDDILSIGIAALFHDIGKLYISEKILKKASKLTDEEFAQIKSHTLLGAEILLEYVDTLGFLPVVVAFEHHLRYNLSGYPKMPFAKKPHLASLIVNTCDVYDALFQRRGYKIDYSPDMIYNVMMRERTSSFDPELLDKFFKIMGVWPIGSIVSLTDGRIAVVEDENENDIFSPKVEVVHPPDKKEHIDLIQTKDKIKIDRFLNPWKEGKEFLNLIKPN